MVLVNSKNGEWGWFASKKITKTMRILMKKTKISHNYNKTYLGCVTYLDVTCLGCVTYLCVTCLGCVTYLGVTCLGCVTYLGVTCLGCVTYLGVLYPNMWILGIIINYIHEILTHSITFWQCIGRSF